MSELLSKNAIREINPSNEPPGFYSTVFLTEKHTGGWRPILNLKPLNKTSIKPVKFRQETLKSVRSSLAEMNVMKEMELKFNPDRFPEPGPWATTLDLKDAYFHVPIHPEDTKFLRFAFEGKCYEFIVLPFGLSTSPRVFTRVVRALSAFLHRLNVRMFPYLDDWFTVTETFALAIHNTDLVRHWAGHVGFLLNLKKSNLIPTQRPTFIGALLDLQTNTVYPTSQTVDKVSQDPTCSVGPRVGNSERMASSVGSSSQFSGSSSQRSSAFQTDSVYGILPMVSGQSTRQHSDSTYSSRQRRAELVEVKGESSSRSSLCSSRSRHRDILGCVRDRLGRSSGGTANLRSLVSQSSSESHKLVGTEGSFSHSSSFRRSTASSFSPHLHRQHNSSLLPEQGRGVSLSQSVQPCHRDSLLVSRERYHSISNSHSRCPECSSRWSDKTENYATNRVVPKQTCSQVPF